MPADSLQTSVSEASTSTLVLAAVLGVGAIVLLADLVRRLLVNPVTLSLVATDAWDGITTGLILGLAGVGLSMTYSILSFSNFAHGDYLTTGAFTGWATTWAVAGYGSVGLGKLVLLGAGGNTYASAVGVNVLDTPLAIVAGLVVAVVATVLVSLAVDRIVFEPLRDAEGITVLVASIGVALALRYALVLVWQQSTRGLTSGGGSLFVWQNGARVYLKVSYSDATLAVVALCVLAGCLGGLPLGGSGGLTAAWHSDTPLRAGGSHHPAAVARFGGQTYVAAGFGDVGPNRTCAFAVTNATGSVRWNRTIPRDACGTQPAGDPTFGDVTGDGRPEVVWATRAPPGTSSSPPSSSTTPRASSCR